MEKKKKKKKHRHSKKSDEQELKVTTRGEGVDTSVWSITISPKDSSSSLSSPSEGDSGLGSNPPRRGTDTESRRGVVLRSSPVATRDSVTDAEDAPLSDPGEGNGGEGDGDQEMPDATGQQDEGDMAGSVTIPQESQEEQMDDDQAKARDDDEPQEPWENPGRSSSEASEQHPRLCRRCTGRLVGRYKFSSGRTWQRPPARTRTSCTGLPDPFTTG